MAETLKPDPSNTTSHPDVFAEFPHLKPVLSALGLPIDAILIPPVQFTMMFFLPRWLKT